MLKIFQSLPTAYEIKSKLDLFQLTSPDCTHAL